MIGASLLLTITAWRFSEQQVENQSVARFERESAQVVELVVERLQKYELALWGGASAVQALGGEASLDEWRTFARTARIEREYPGIAGIGIIEPVPHENLASYLAAQRILRPDFMIHPTLEADEHYPITYIEPAEDNALAVGLDMAHETNRADGVARVRDSGLPQLAGPITLVQDERQTPGFLFFVPLYRGGEDESVEERRANFGGIVYAPFVVRELMAGTLSRERRHVGVRIDDGDETLYDEHVVGEPDYDPEPQYSETHDVQLYGRTWRFHIQSARSFRAAAASRQPLIVLIGGIFIDLLLLAFFIMLSGKNRSALTSNQELEQTIAQLEVMQDDLKATKTSLERRDGELQRQRAAAMEIAAEATVAQENAEQAEQRSKVVVESAPNAMIMVDEKGMIVLVNTETERIFGHAREELLGQPIELLIPKTKDEQSPTARSGLSEAPKPQRLGTTSELVGVRKDGSEFPLALGLNPIETSQGRYVLSAVVDLTERREAQRRFEQAVESAPNAMVMVNRSGQIVLVNAEAERIFGYDRDEMVGELVERLLPQHIVDGSPNASELFAVSSKKRVMGAGQQLYARRKDGSEFPAEIGLNPIETPDGRFVLSSIVDNTERKRILDQLENRTEEMEQLLYTVSHDLKSPLVTIQGFSELITEALERNDIEDAIDSAGRVSRATTTMAALIKDVLELSRVTRAEEEAEWVDIGALIADVAESLDSQFVAAEARLVINRAPPIIHTIARRVQQIFLNLVGNALKYGCDSPGSTIEIGYVQKPRHHEFYVRDHGPGIAPAHHEKVFMIFRRMTTDKEGTGLGLAIVMKAARSLGGQAWLESELGEGTTVRFSVAKNHFRRPNTRRENTDA